MKIENAAAALGRLGGKSKSRAKRAASKRNGKLGGWPKGKKRGPRKVRPTASQPPPSSAD